MTQGQYPLGAQEGIVPCSDGAGEIISVSPSVKDFKIGDRVCPNFALDHIFGDIESETQMATSLGAKIDGCLTEVRAFPAYVSFFLLRRWTEGGRLNTLPVSCTHSGAPLIRRGLDPTLCGHHGLQLSLRTRSSQGW